MKKFFAILITSALAFALIMGCSSNQEDPNTGVPDQPTSETEAPSIPANGGEAPATGSDQPADTSTTEPTSPDASTKD